MKKLQIAKTLSLPIDAATQTFAFIARKGAGKTYTAGKLVELFLEAKVQVVVLDTVGNWYGLRLAADGKRPGFDVPVLGGLRGDIPLDPATGQLIADIVVETGRSMVLDVSQWSKADRQRFAAAFGERLWLRKKAERHPSPVHLVIEESQLIVPQDVRGDTATMVGIFEEIIRLGRNYGIGVSMITQRPQSVNKEVLNMTECLFVGQVNGSQERDALKKWITTQGMDKDLVDELPGLPIGTFYVWSPQWLQVLEKVEILPKTTYDASATPKVGDKRVQRDLKPLDLSELQGRMVETIEKAKADDPRELKKQLATLKADVAAKAKAVADLDARLQQSTTQLASVRTSKKEEARAGKIADLQQQLARHRRALEEAMKILVKVKAVDFSARGGEALEDAVTHAVKQVTAGIEKRVTALADRVAGIQATAAAAETAIQQLLSEHIELAVTVQKQPATVTTTVARAATAAPARPPAAPTKPVDLDGETKLATPDGTLKKHVRAILTAFAQHADGLKRQQALILAGYQPSGDISTAFGEMIARGWLVESAGRIKVTAAGLAALGPYELLPVGAALRQALLDGTFGKSSKVERQLLRVWFDAYPNALARKDAIAAAGYKPSGDISTAIGKFVRLDWLVEAEGGIRAADLFFEGE